MVTVRLRALARSLPVLRDRLPAGATLATGWLGMFQRLRGSTG